MGVFKFGDLGTTPKLRDTTKIDPNLKTKHTARNQTDI